MNNWTDPFGGRSNRERYDRHIGSYNAPAFVSLGHEIHHAYEYITGTIQGFSVYEGRNPPWEMGALKAENRIRSFYGFQRKQNYTQNPRYYEPGKNPVISLPAFKVNGN